MGRKCSWFENCFLEMCEAATNGSDVDYCRCHNIPQCFTGLSVLFQKLMNECECCPTTLCLQVLIPSSFIAAVALLWFCAVYTGVLRSLAANPFNARFHPSLFKPAAHAPINSYVTEVLVHVFACPYFFCPPLVQSPQFFWSPCWWKNPFFPPSLSSWKWLKTHPLSKVKLCKTFRKPGEVLHIILGSKI